MTKLTEIIYLHESGDSLYSMHKMTVAEQDNGDPKYSIGPWEKDSQWLPAAFAHPENVSIVEHGNGVELRIRRPGTESVQLVDLDFSQVTDLMMLLDAYNRDQRFVSSFKRFQEVD
jgi:hypothetical protein